MKKRFAAAAVLLAGTLAFAACSSRVALTMNRNWNENTASAYGNFYEQLVYDVRYQREDTSSLNGLYYADVEGTYTVTVRSYDYYNAETKVQADRAYELTSVLEVSASVVNGEGETVYAFGGDTDAPADKIETVVYFRDIDEEMRPLESRVKTYSHTPGQNNDIAVYSYESAVVYSANGKSASVTVTDLSDEIEEITEDTTGAYAASFKDRSYSLSDLTEDYSCLDNAQLLFAARGITFADGDSHTFTAVSPAGGRRNVTMTCSEVLTSNYSFTLDGQAVAEEEAGKPISTNVVTFALAGGGATGLGVTHTVHYAARSSNPSANTYRNLPLRIESPVAYSMGSFVYVLESASHTAAE